MAHLIELVPLSELQENPANPKNHNENLIDKSLATFGYIDPIVVDQRTGLLISGHGRKQVLTIMQAEGKDAPAGITVGKDGEWLVPVVTGWASKDDTEARAALVALNRTTEQGGWDRENLLEILQELSEIDALDTVGFAKADLSILEKALEAEDVFTMDISEAIDEFIGDTGVSPERIPLTFSSSLRVYFQTPEARQEFFNLIGYTNDEKQQTIRYPATFQKQASEVWNG